MHLKGSHDSLLSPLLTAEGIMAAKEISVKRYVVRLSADEREQLQALIRKGKSSAKRLLKARILLKADVSEAGEGWSDSRIIKALETSVSMVYRVRKQLVEEGLEAVLSRKQRATPAVPRIFDGEKEAKLIALACSKPTSSGITRQSTAVGSTWRNPNSASYRLSASTAASPTNKPSSTKSSLKIVQRAVAAVLNAIYEEDF